MHSVSLATPASVAATEKTTLTIKDMLELIDGSACIAHARDANIDVDLNGTVHIKPNIIRRKRRACDQRRQAERSRKHKIRGGGSAANGKNILDERDDGGDGDIVLEICALGAAIDATASMTASELDRASVVAGAAAAAGDTAHEEQQQEAAEAGELAKAAAVYPMEADDDEAAAEQQQQQQQQQQVAKQQQEQVQREQQQEEQQQQEQQRQQQQTVAVAAEAPAATAATEAAAHEAAAATEDEAAAAEIAAVEGGDNEEDDEEEAEVPERHAHSAGVGKRQAVGRAPVSDTPAPAPRSKKLGLLGERARAGIKKSDISEPSKGYATSVYKMIMEEEQQARVQTIFYELRAEGYDPNEAAALAFERARGQQ